MAQRPETRGAAYSPRPVFLTVSFTWAFSSRLANSITTGRRVRRGLTCGRHWSNFSWAWAAVMPRYFISQHMRDGGTASAPRFAVDVNRFASSRVFLNELHSLLDIFDAGMCEVGGWNVQLFHSIFGVLFDWTGVLFAGIDHRANAFLFHRCDIASKRKRADDDMGIDVIPPVTHLQYPSQQKIPAERRIEDGFRVQASQRGMTHRGSSFPTSRFAASFLASSKTSAIVTGTPPLALLSAAACMNAYSSMVSVASTGG